MAPYGSWASPISAAAASVAGRTVEGLAVAGDGRLVWVEKRPEQGGASVLVREAAEPGGGAVDMTPEGFAVRTLAQEYGGGSGAFAVQGDTVVFSNYSDQRLYKQTIGGGTSPLPVTPDYAGSTVRYADGVFDPHFCRYVTIMEDHRDKSSSPITTIAALNIHDRALSDCLPRFTYLFVLIIFYREVQKKICIAGGDPTLVESPTEPKWSSKGELFFITDRQSGFWNIYKWFRNASLRFSLHHNYYLGGPTDEARGILDLNVQYWTSRGWALVDVNYGGSSGYGRKYRERLLGQWGIVDVNDTCSCATFLIADLSSLRAGSHKFEAYYTDNLVGNKQAYFERSPINFVDKFTCPLILFHGLKDTAENIKFTMEQEMVFFARLVGKFNVADDITPIKIENFD
nr:unnamed protein product [Digitaria exilis]